MPGQPPGRAAGLSRGRSPARAAPRLAAHHGAQLGFAAGARFAVASINTSRADPRDYHTVQLGIGDTDTGVALCSTPTGASATMRWLKAAEVQLDSADTGTRCWQEQPAGHWVDVPYSS